MNLKFFSDPTELKIVQEIRKWSSDVLEIPNPYFNNFSPCPFAKKAWLDNKVAILFKKEEGYQCLYSCISMFDDSFDIVILVDLCNTKDSEQFQEYLDGLNVAISNGLFLDKDIWLMGFHPEDEPNEFLEEVEFEPLVEEEYAMIFIQRLSKLQESADKLKQKGYYDSYNKDYNAQDIYNLRQKLYRRLKNGNET